MEMCYFCDNIKWFDILYLFVLLEISPKVAQKSPFVPGNQLSLFQMQFMVRGATPMKSTCPKTLFSTPFLFSP